MESFRFGPLLVLFQSVPIFVQHDLDVTPVTPSMTFTFLNLFGAID